MSKVVRVQGDALEIVLSYGPTVSEGIRVMHQLLQRQQRCSFDVEAVREVIREEIEHLSGY